MNNEKKEIRFSFLMLYCIAVLIAVFARLGIDIMDAMGVFTYSYKGATAPYAASGPLLDKICVLLTGGSLVALIFAGALALSLAVAGVLLFAHLYGKDAFGKHTVDALIWGILTAIVSFICFFVVVLGLFSAVQMSQASGSMKAGAGLAVGGLLFVVAIGTLLAAASLVVCACIVRGGDRRNIAFKMLRAAVVCGLVVLVCVIGTYAPMTSEQMNTGALGLWLVIDIVANVAMMLVAVKLTHPVAAKTKTAKAVRA